MSCHKGFNTGIYKGNSFLYELNPDSSFKYKFTHHMIGDESSGVYAIKNKKIYFSYSADTLSARPTRPMYAAIKGKRIYPVLNDSIGIDNKWFLKRTN